LKSFRDKYVAKSGLIVGDSQTSLALAFVFGLYPDDAEQHKTASARLEKLVRHALFKVSNGFAGTPVVLEGLTKGGYLEVAYRMLLEEGNPSWLYPVTQGATTVWERWDSMLEDGSINPGEMTSFNHYALGSVASWLHQTVGGLKPLEPGWKTFLVRPRPGGTITSAEAKFLSPYGECRCAWELVDAHDAVRMLKVNILVPLNTTAYRQKPDGTRTRLGSGLHQAEWEFTREAEWPPKAINVF
jgi:alpha-L-rhamnosidase